MQAKQPVVTTRLDYSQSKPPPGYIPGLGRGATGFTTRSDIGPARAAPDLTQTAEVQPQAPKADGDDENDELQFDEFMGNDQGMLAGNLTGEYDEEDKEADLVWEQIDDHIDKKRRDRREQLLKEKIEKYRKENPKITEQFQDLKRNLSQVSKEQWEGIPEIGDYSIKKQKRQTFTPVPDTLLAQAAAEKKLNTTLDQQLNEKLGQPNQASRYGLETPYNGMNSTMNTDLTAIGEGRGQMLRLKIDKLSDSVSGQTVVDPKGYLTDLKSMKITTDAELSDIKRARLLLKSAIQSNPKYGPGWIAAARLEEMAGKHQDARKFIMQGCEECPKSEDIWLEAARLHPPESAKTILARGAEKNPQSVKIWMQAARTETNKNAQGRVLRKALENIPNSVALWKAAVELADADDARVLLTRAVECCPTQVELWLALARLETGDRAKRVLNDAVQVLPREPAIYIAGAKLQESQGKKVGAIISNGLRRLKENDVIIDREFWLREAEKAEKSDPPMIETCKEIVKNVVSVGVELEDRKRTWLADSDDCVKKGSIETARAILDFASTTMPGKKSVWRKFAEFENSHGTPERVEKVLAAATKNCPKAEILWLMAAKSSWLRGNINEARETLSKAFDANPNSEEIWLAAFKIEFETKELDRARALMAKARQSDSASTQRVWMKSVVVERQLKNYAEERKLLEQGLQLYPESWKMSLMLGQHFERSRDFNKARQVYYNGLQRRNDCVPLYIHLASLEEKQGQVGKARAELEKARLKVPKNPELWLAAIRLEIRKGNTKEIENLMAKALQDCPKSGRLWSLAIGLERNKSKKKSRSQDAIKECDNDPYIFAAIAQLFWDDRRIEKARNYFNRSVILNPDIGDIWATWYKFELQHGTKEDQQLVLQKCLKADPKHGEKWQSISKDPANTWLKPEQILMLVKSEIDKQDNA